MDSKIDVSVIIPMYNSEAFIERQFNLFCNRKTMDCNLKSLSWMMVALIGHANWSTKSKTTASSWFSYQKIKARQMHGMKVSGWLVENGFNFWTSDDRIGDAFINWKDLQPSMNCYLFSFMREFPDLRSGKP